MKNIWDLGFWYKDKWDLIYIGWNLTSDKSKPTPIKLILCTLFLRRKNILWSHFHSFVAYKKELMTCLLKQSLISPSWKAGCTKQDFFSSCPSAPRNTSSNLEERKNTFWCWISLLWCRSVNHIEVSLLSTGEIHKYCFLLATEMNVLYYRWFRKILLLADSKVFSASKNYIKESWSCHL